VNSSILNIIRIFISLFFIGYFSEVDKKIYLIRFIFGLWFFVEIFLLTKKTFYNSKLSENKKGLYFSLLFMFSILMLLEFAIMFIPRSHGVGYTKASKLWTKLYWKPINQFGFRDKEIEKTDKDLIIFIGDSFTAGYGINKIENRFSDLIESKSKNFRSINMGINATDSKDHHEILTDITNKVDLKPKHIVLQYFGNDIDKTAIAKKLPFPGFKLYSNLNLVSKILIESSFLLNYVYWLFPQSDAKDYWNFLEKAYQNEDVLNEHLKDLDGIIELSKNKSAKLTVLLIPYLHNLEESEKIFADKIETYFTKKEIEVINVTDLIKDIKLKDRVVNSNDGHASEQVQEIIADELIKSLNNY
jgi:lysophospholipase L1-like esterase